MNFLAVKMKAMVLWHLFLLISYAAAGPMFGIGCTAIVGVKYAACMAGAIAGAAIVSGPGAVPIFTLCKGLTASWLVGCAIGILAPTP